MPVIFFLVFGIFIILVIGLAFSNAIAYIKALPIIGSIPYEYAPHIVFGLAMYLAYRAIRALWRKIFPPAPKLSKEEIIARSKIKDPIYCEGKTYKEYWDEYYYLGPGKNKK